MKTTRILAVLFIIAMVIAVMAPPGAAQGVHAPEEGCDKLEFNDEGPDWVADADYSEVRIKAGTEVYTWTNVKAGDILTVPTGKDVSYVIRCGEDTPTTTTTSPPTTVTTTPSSSTTTIPSTTTTTPGTTTSSTVPTTVSSTTSTVVSTTSTVPSTPTEDNPDLPYTGIGDWFFIAAVLAMGLLGTGGVLVARNRA